MTDDMTGIKVLLMAGKSLSAAQQAWAPLLLEGFAQLEMKRAQRSALGSMKSICWTDHANWTRQQTTPDPDIKVLRWVSEIVADGSEIRSLSGRAAKLGDGTSRNPPDRDKLMAQRAKDIEGLMGQVRGFDLDEYLGDWEQSRYAQTWTLPSDALPNRSLASLQASSSSVPSRPGQSSKHDHNPGPVPFRPGQEGIMVANITSTDSQYAHILAAEGVFAKFKVLLVPDFLPVLVQREVSQKLWREFSQSLPAREVVMGVCQGPFEDDDGNGAHFEARKTKLAPDKLRLEIRKDLLTSMVNVLRKCAQHKPEVLIGEGQGAVVVLSLLKPLLVEAAMQMRNVQRKEVQEAAEAWNNVKLILARKPRMFMTKPGFDLWVSCTPEFDDKNIRGNLWPGLD
jgi:hypothetical protein